MHCLECHRIKQIYVLLGDFNAHVGHIEASDNQWDGIRGQFGYGQMNVAGKELVSLLCIHETTVCIIIRKAIYQQTWQHPESKHWHCIDYVIMHQTDRKMCMDVSMKRGAEYI